MSTEDPLPVRSNKQLALFVFLCLLHFAFARSFLEVVHGPGSPGTLEYFRAYMGIGILASQPMLLAVLAGLGPWPLVKQIPGAVLAVLLVSILAMWPTHPSAFDATATILGELALFSCSLICLAIACYRRGIRIAYDTTLLPSTSDRQFSIRSIFLLTVGIALICSLLRYLLQSSADPFQLKEAGERIVFATALTLLVTGNLLFVGVVFAVGGRILLAIVGFVTMPAANLLALIILKHAHLPGDRNLMSIGVPVECGVLFSMAITLLPFRWCGYRLVRKYAGETQVDHA